MCFDPPPAGTNPFAYSCIITFHTLYKNDMICWGNNVKVLKNNLFLNLLRAKCVQICR